ncbi:IS481 family transposase [Rhodococcus sp. SORGH_AS_0303]|uniref:IS481 family transposase n=1 Tax=Rhodococcus sp. SORGH_AS_0303 TaxID=3041753 RepID=UPI002788DD40|nr:IS481 family transposase [Rhodococcus sp. SORGH_AS_0303]MDQ1200773.1 transposase InsO family protein [Rhodococcus sp. SORGH_AS_0303]
MTHANAYLTPRGRLDLARTIVDTGWTVRRAAERFQCSPATASKWARRYAAGGAAAMGDASSRPHRSPTRTDQRTERRIINLRFTRRWGPHRIAYHLHLARSTVEAVLRRYAMPLLSHLDQNTGLPVRRLRAQRYEHPTPGDLVHVDIKKLGRIPDGGGHRKFGRTIGNRHNKKQSLGYSYVHHAVDDHSRLAYSEILTDERKETAAAFWTRAQAYFAAHGVTVTRVLTDNGSCYRSTLFAEALGTVVHKRTRPYRPQTNGKVERFNRTLAAEWAYAHTYLSDEARAATYQDWIHTYNHHRPHTGIGGQSPIDRVPVRNVPGNYT